MSSKTLRIGFLTPYSSFYPYYAPQITTGFFLGLGESPSKQAWVEFVPAFTHTGGEEAMKEAARKLLFFDRCDMLSGLVSYKTIPAIMPEMERANATGFFLDMGENIPSHESNASYLFYNSHQLWQGEYALGLFAQKEFGNGGYIVTNEYEGGYHLAASFQQGLTKAGGTEVNLHIFPRDGANPEVMYLGDLFQEISQQAPPYVHLLVSGQQAIDFMALWVQQGFHHSIPLLITDMVAQEDVLQDLRHLPFTVYAPSLWSRTSEDYHNQVFVKAFEQSTQQPANVYALLGYEMGLAFKDLKPQLLQKDWTKARELLQKEVIQGPRGARGFYPDAAIGLPHIDIMKYKLGGGAVQKTIVAEGKGLPYNEQTFQQILNGAVSGWKNPYLCY